MQIRSGAEKKQASVVMASRGCGGAVASKTIARTPQTAKAIIPRTQNRNARLFRLKRLLNIEETLSIAFSEVEESLLTMFMRIIGPPFVARTTGHIYT
jgi:hypothetical protein